jgi:hypothetical protein
MKNYFRCSSTATGAESKISFVCGGSLFVASISFFSILFSDNAYQ